MCVTVPAGREGPHEQARDRPGPMPSDDSDRSPMDIEGAVAIVTGGASGLGLATTEALLEAGARVVVLDLPGSPGVQVADRLGEGVRFAAADVRDEKDVAAALDVADSLGPLRVAV